MPSVHELRFPFAVHTARYGYDWSAVPPGLSREELDSVYRLAVSRRPEFLPEGAFVFGVLAREGLAAVFRLQVAQAWDANGRDAEYAAFVFVPQTDWRRVDFAVLLDDPALCRPLRSPPRELSYAGPPSEPADEMTRLAVCRTEGGELSARPMVCGLGAALAESSAGSNWRALVAVRTEEGERWFASGANAPRRMEVADTPSDDAAKGVDWGAVVLWTLAAFLSVLAIWRAVIG